MEKLTKEFIYKDVKVSLYGDIKGLSDREVERYITDVEAEKGSKCVELSLFADSQNGEEFIGRAAKVEPIPFERIRRITGYLVGTLDRFNDGKKAEESLRVKHSVSSGMEQL